MEKPPNMAPTWLPKRSQNGLKIDAKIDQNFDGFRDRFLKDFGGFLAPKSIKSRPKNDQKTIQNRSKLDQKSIIIENGDQESHRSASGQSPPGFRCRKKPQKPPNMAPAWLPKRSQNGLKINAKIDQNFDNFRDRFLKDFNGFLAPKWSQVGTKIDQKSMPIAKCDFLKNRALAAAGARFLRFWGSKLGIKID